MNQGPISIQTDTVTTWAKSHDTNAETVAASAQWDTSGYAAHFGDAYHAFTQAVAQVAPIRARSIEGTAAQSRQLAQYGREDVAAFTETSDTAAATYRAVID
ncbi:hypothetical protein [Tsukamurella ocularis]|uniref:hypothetical protein n=1 Tax=Tsukamurella ocularis TaxID=1970234 RepID=UPI002168345D|nr:hypothetical protein [Tsukamurella ocularis]MCS3853311.1 hypothetical protein [Tsukamurella ocularis]